LGIIEKGSFTSLEEIRIKPFIDERLLGRKAQVRSIEGLLTEEDEEDDEMKANDKHFTQFRSFPALKLVSLETTFRTEAENEDSDMDSDEED